MESKKNLQFNDDFENFILCFSVSHGAIEHLSGADGSPSVLETCNISSQWLSPGLSFLPSQILIELELSQEVNS